ncbi:MAG: ABC transporter permease, partial [Thiotrichales bacterium]|nr:ABC transporter permease [Thiotrichales bacterium]
MPVLFLTDILIFILLLMVIVFIWYARQHEHLRVPWRQVGQNRMAMASAVILLLYIVIGLLDSIHFHPRLQGEEGAAATHSTGVISVLDVMTRHLVEQTEKTYSAPFATHAYARETVELEGGGRSRVYPRLEYGGAHLADPAGKSRDVVLKSVIAVVAGCVLWLLISALIVLLLARSDGSTFRDELHRIRQGETHIPWNVVLLTLGVVVVLLSWSYYLSHYYHIFGTDKVGQDVFYQALKSIRTGLMIGTLTTLVMLPFALMLGIMAGYFRGWIDDVIQYIYTTLNSIPGVLLIAA